jgi:hypothetical protein
LIIDNWDNLTSHTFFYIKPDLLTVWGEQTKNHAIKFHNFDRNNVYTFGNPKFNNYLRLKDKVLESRYNFKYILFLGSFVDWDEINCVIKLGNIINANNLNIKIIYRPHPSSYTNKNKITDYISKSGNKNIILDKVVKENETFLNSNVTNLTDKSRLYIEPKNYFESLIQNCELSIGTLSTITIESLIFKKKFMIIAYPQENNEFDPQNIYKYAEYAKGLSDIELIKVSKNINNFENEFLNFYNLKINTDVNELSKKIDYFYDSNNINTLSNLTNIISKV